MSDIVTGYSFTDGESATAAKLNVAVGSAAIQAALITGKSAVTPAAADSILLYDASGAVLIKSTLTALWTAAAGTSAGTLAAGNDSRFSASVTGLRLGAGAGADTAAKAKDLAFAPTSAALAAGAATLNCANNNLFTIRVDANATITLSNVSDGDTICVEITQDATGSRTIAWVTTQTLTYEGNTAFTPSTAAASVDLWFFKRIGNNLRCWIKQDFGT